MPLKKRKEISIAKIKKINIKRKKRVKRRTHLEKNEKNTGKFKGGQNRMASSDSDQNMVKLKKDGRKRENNKNGIKGNKEKRPG